MLSHQARVSPFFEYHRHSLRFGAIVVRIGNVDVDHLISRAGLNAI
jgi:hypothetical protein